MVKTLAEKFPIQSTISSLKETVTRSDYCTKPTAY